MELTIQSDIRVNSLFWIKSLEPSKLGPTRRVLEDLEPFLDSYSIRFKVIDPQTTSELLDALDMIADQARNGIRPMIHFDTHGNKGAGLYLVPSQEFVGWDILAHRLRQINIATENNLCVISAACFGFYITQQNTILQPVMFYLLIGPTKTVSFGFAEENLFLFYKDVFTQQNIISAYHQYLAPQMGLFHSEKLFTVAMKRYFRFKCMGRGAQKRIERLVSEQIQMPNNLNTLKQIRAKVKKTIKPSEATFRKYAILFLIGKEPSVTFDHIIRFIRSAPGEYQPTVDRPRRRVR
jgi:hypothetical protein